jgi:GNAT superfamily N-acetyltransferase
MDSLVRLGIELHEFMAEGAPDRLRALPEYDLDEIRDYFARLLARPDGHAFVAESEGSVVGYAEIFLADVNDGDDAVVATRRAHLQSLVVSPAHRGRGIGGALLHAAEDWARDRSVQEVELDHWVFDGDPSGFYEAAGYRSVRVTRTRALS